MSVRKAPVKLAWILCLLTLMSVQWGCRTLRTNRHTRNLTLARQLSRRGAGLLEQENFREAGPLFGEALEHSPADERAHWGMAQVCWQRGERARAIEHMATAGELDGQNPDFFVRLGEMHLASGNLDEAIKQADMVLRQKRQHSRAWALKGAVHKARQEYEDSLDCYQLALTHDSGDAQARIEVAEIYRSLGKPHRALATIEYLADGHTMGALPARAWMLKGQALSDLGEQTDAQDCLRQASMYADPNDTNLLLQLATEQHKSGNSGEARLLLGMVLRNSPNDPGALGLQGLIGDSFQSDGPTLPGLPAGQRSALK
ncbi:MAG: tetratricopeptide repeat protein [Planctomycetota bacterium]